MTILPSTLTSRSEKQSVSGPTLTASTGKAGGCAGNARPVGLADLPVRLLSAGQKRRGALARLLASDAPIWLLDEPYNGLDQANVARLDAALSRHTKKAGLRWLRRISHRPSTSPAALLSTGQRRSWPHEWVCEHRLARGPHRLDRRRAVAADRVLSCGGDTVSVRHRPGQGPARTCGR
jgi:hypothetical protein